MTFLYLLALQVSSAGTAADGRAADENTGLGLIAWIVIGAIAGWIAEQVMKSDMPLWQNILLGIVGALVGGFLFGLIGLNFGGFFGSLITATLGAMLVIWIARKVRGGSRARV
jgi:uncharacterized membrane protein YeaQ/YmgE (transglycosylase-associated protein family)